jgi:hypothetical protein
MSEITIITTMEVTRIYKDIKEDFKVNKKCWANGTKEVVKNALDADDVVVTNVQEFVLDENN